MKTLLNIGVLLVSVSALAQTSTPSLYQYWLDSQQSDLSMNTKVYDPSSNKLTIDGVSGLSEGGHALHIRMATEDKENGKVKWGRPVT